MLGGRIAMLGMGEASGVGGAVAAEWGVCGRREKHWLRRSGRSSATHIAQCIPISGPSLNSNTLMIGWAASQRQSSLNAQAQDAASDIARMC